MHMLMLMLCWTLLYVRGSPAAPCDTYVRNAVCAFVLAPCSDRECVRAEGDCEDEIVTIEVGVVS